MADSKRLDRASTDAKGFRPSVQGLRAVAVMLVVLFHLWPGRLSGGYVGVDVFFVISGYLITAHIAREMSSTGTLNVPRFWGRRIRRLIPASLTVLAATAVMTILWMPQTAWNTIGRHILASTLYVENLALAHDAVDYQALDQDPTPVQHFWSLSVEEQFYFTWPLLLVVVWWALRRTRIDVRLVTVGVLATIAVVTLGVSVWLTYQDRASAYFLLQTRMWEFALGGLVAVIFTASRLPPRVRSALAWSGLIAIVLAAATFDADTVFPGYLAAIPAVGAAVFIAAGESGMPGGLSRILSSRPFTFVGDISYSVYLWHWPLIIVWPFAWGSPIGRLDALAILALTFALAWGTKVFVEDPGRRSAWLGAATWRPFIAAAAGMAVIVAGIGATHEIVQRQNAREALALESALDPTCRGPEALADPANCSDKVGKPPVVPGPQVVADEVPVAPYRNCQQSFLPVALKSCEIGSQSADVEKTIAIVGDSHATHWLPTLDLMGKELNWRVVTYTKVSCPLTLALRVLDNEQTSAEQTSCAVWRDAVIDELISDSRISVVMAAGYTTAYGFDSPSDNPMTDPRVDGFAQVYSMLADHGKTVIGIADVPRTIGANVPACIEASPQDFAPCNTLRAESTGNSAIVAAVTTLDEPAVQLADLTDFICDATTCYAAVGNMIVYRDHSHLSRPYAKALAPMLQGATVAALARSSG